MRKAISIALALTLLWAIFFGCVSLAIGISNGPQFIRDGLGMIAVGIVGVVVFIIANCSLYGGMGGKEIAEWIYTRYLRAKAP